MIGIIGVLSMLKLYSDTIGWLKITAPVLNAKLKEKNLKTLLRMIKDTGRKRIHRNKEPRLEHTFHLKNNCLSQDCKTKLVKLLLHLQCIAICDCSRLAYALAKLVRRPHTRFFMFYRPFAANIFS